MIAIKQVEAVPVRTANKLVDLIKSYIIISTLIVSIVQ